MSLQSDYKDWLEKKYNYMKLNEYQEKALATAIYPNNSKITYPALGLVGEAGEIANKVKKFIRDGYSPEEYESKKLEIASEIGDVLWYCSALANDLDMSLSVIAAQNLDKLEDRKKRNQLQGSGDNR